jgi:K+-transporting ATPase c subunit
MKSEKNTGHTIVSPGPSEPAGSFLHHLWASIAFTVTLGIICCGVYPLIVYGLAMTFFPNQANGSLVKKDGTPTTEDKDAVGSSLLGQNFTMPGYFHPRPSAAGNGYDPTSSGGSNLGPLSAKLMHGTTNTNALTVIAVDKKHSLGPIAGRFEGTVAAVTGTSITISSDGGKTKQTYTLDASVADPNTVVNSRGRTIHATTLSAPTHTGTSVELLLNSKTPAAVTAINVIDQSSDAASNTIDTTAKTITLPGPTANDPTTVINLVDGKTAYIVNGTSGAKITDVTPDMAVHVVATIVESYDGIADRVIHYCEDNSIGYKCSLPTTDFKDADGIDDSKLIQELNAASDPPTITPDKPIPGDAVTASGSGLDPHIGPENAQLQIGRIAAARNIKPEQVQKVMDAHTDQPSLGFLGDPGVNVLMANLALDKEYPLPAAPTTAPASK